MSILKDEKKLNPEVLRVKTFMQAMNWFDLSADEKKEFLKDKRLSQVEKSILESSLWIRENRFQEVESRLTKLTITNPLIESQRSYVLGVCLNASSKSHESIKCFLQAAQIFCQFELRSYEFNTYVQLFYAYLNLKMKSSLEQVLEHLNEIKSQDVLESISYLRCRFNFLVFCGEYRKALTPLRKLEELAAHMHPGQFVSFLVDKFIFYLKTERWESCEKTLNELKKHRHYRLTESFNYTQALFRHFRFHEPIYLYDEQFKKVPILYFQLKVIQHLSSGEKELAQTFWMKLQELNSDVYRHDFNYQGDVCLFSLCLERYQSGVAQMSFKHLGIKINQLSPLEQKLIHLLQAGPVTKEVLYLKLWDVPLNSKQELKKLTMVVLRIKRKTGLEINSHKGSYLIKLENKFKKKIG